MSTSQNTFVGRSNFSSAITMSRGPVGVTSYPRAPRRDTSEEEWFDKGHKAGASPIPLSVRVERSEETSV